MVMSSLFCIQVEVVPVVSSLLCIQVVSVLSAAGVKQTLYRLLAMVALYSHSLQVAWSSLPPGGSKNTLGLGQ